VDELSASARVAGMSLQMRGRGMLGELLGGSSFFIVMRRTAALASYYFLNDKETTGHAIIKVPGGVKGTRLVPEILGGNCMINGRGVGNGKKGTYSGDVDRVTLAGMLLNYNIGDV